MTPTDFYCFEAAIRVRLLKGSRLPAPKQIAPPGESHKSRSQGWLMRSVRRRWDARTRRLVSPTVAQRKSSRPYFLALPAPKLIAWRLDNWRSPRADAALGRGRTALFARSTRAFLPTFCGPPRDRKKPFRYTAQSALRTKDP